MAFKPIDPKRDEFRRYLERSGLIEALTKVFVRIVKERPENPLEYLRHNLGDSLHQADNVAYLQTELDEARCEIQRLREIIENVSPESLVDGQQQNEGGIDSAAANEEKITAEQRTNGVEQKELENGAELNGSELAATVRENVENLAAAVASTEATPQTIPAADAPRDGGVKESEAQSGGVNKNHIDAETIPSAPMQTEADNNS